eukprot:6204489-Pleurochrysis_carterae.AAC.1
MALELAGGREVTAREQQDMMWQSGSVSVWVRPRAASACGHVHLRRACSRCQSHCPDNGAFVSSNSAGSRANRGAGSRAERLRRVGARGPGAHPEGRGAAHEGPQQGAAVDAIDAADRLQGRASLD